MDKSKSATTKRYDAVVIGAGFAGVYMVYKLRQLGLSVRLYETADGPGGTWYWNRYPGAACDIESFEYSYSFSDELQQQWKWSERFPRQAELLAYINHVVDRFDLRRDMQFGTRVSSAVFDEAAQRWRIATDGGDQVEAQFCVMATGCLSAPKKLDLPGTASFKGEILHTAWWPKEAVDFSGKRVAVVGTGSSGIQCIPIIAEAAKHLHVFQRTPNFSVPAGNRPVDAAFERLRKDNYAALRKLERESDFGIVADMPQESRAALAVSAEAREQEYEKRWSAGGLYFYGSFVDLFVSREANDTLADFARRKIRAKIKNPVVADLLVPKGYPFGAKRICADTNYYETFNRDNVTLVDISQMPISGFTERGLKVGDQEYEFDMVVFATGFDAMTGALLNIDIRGRGGLALREHWREGPRTYLGLTTTGFPNLFITTGPGSPSVVYNMVPGNEFHVEWIADCIARLRKTGRRTIDATPAAEQEWSDHVDAVGNMTLFPQANSWYVGANIPGKPRRLLPYLGGFRAYSQRCRESAAKDYADFMVN